MRKNQMEHTAEILYIITIDVYKLIKLTRRRSIEKRHILTLGADKIDRTSKSGFTNERYKLADPEYPVLITKDNVLIDGKHRLAKLFDSGKKYVKVRIVSIREIEKCVIETKIME